jgi:amidase
VSVSELIYSSLGEVCARIKSGELSSVQVTQAMLERIGKLNPELHAYVMVLADSALDSATRLDQARTEGAPLGPLHGVPIAIKDLLYTRGFATASGTTVMRDFIPDEDATAVRRLRDAGAVLIGKTQLTEGAFGVHHPDLDAPRNPWNVDHWPGVSSSGSGVAVSAGLAYGALGSDTGGSIRFPSASCGLVGVKASYGRVSRHGAFPLAESLDHIGPMTRSVADAARLLQVLAGADPLDPTSLPDPVPNYASALDQPLAGLRIGVDWQYVETGVDAEVIEAVRDAVAVYTDAGAMVTEFSMPESHQRLVHEWALTTGVECARAHRNYYPARKSEYGPVLSSLIELGLSVTPESYQSLEALRIQFRAELDVLFEQTDLLICPNMPALAPTTLEMSDVSLQDPDRADFLTFTAPFDYSGHPTLTLPVGLSASRLPKSIQLIAGRLQESTLFRAGAGYERIAGFNQRPIP